VVAERGFDAVLEALWQSEVASGRVNDAALRERFFAMCRRCGEDVFVRQTLAIMARADSRPDLGSLPTPVLLLCGRQDAITPLEGHEEIAAGAPQARLVVLEDCGHLSTWERPQEVTAALRTWLAEDLG